MKNILKILTVLFILTNQIGYTQVKNCDGPFQVNLSNNTTHTFDEVLLQLGIATIQEFNSLKPKFDMVIGGTMLLDKPNQEIAFYGTNIKMLANAKISVKNVTTVTLDNVHIYGCGTMWENVEVLNSTVNTLNNCFIEDAKFAISQNSNSKINLQSTTFKNNLYGVTVGGPSQSNIQVSVSNCTFTSDNSFLSNNVFVIGIKIISQKYIDLSPVSGERNKFENLHNGIVAISSSVRVSDCDFLHITVSNYQGDTNSWQNGGYGIHIFNSNSMSIIEHNYFSGMHTAIKANETYLNAHNNIMNSQTGISLQNVERFSIANNNIKPSVAGIMINSTYNYFPPYQYLFRPNTIYNNTIDIHNTGRAIDIQSTNNISVVENHITMENGEAGIFASGSPFLKIHDNKISVKGGTGSLIDGIHLENCSLADVTENNLKQIDYTQCCVPSNTGIYSESTYGNFSCNTIQGEYELAVGFTKAGMEFLFQCDHSTLAGNTLVDNSKDLLLGSYEHDVATIIGLQGDFTNLKGWGNKWTGWSEGSAYNYSEFAINDSRFLVNAYSNPDYLPATIYPSSYWFKNNALATNEDPCSGTNVLTQYDCTDLINKIIMIDTTRKFDECKKAIWKYHYFKKLLRMKKLNQLSAACLAYLNAYNNDEMVKIAKVDTAVAGILINNGKDSVLFVNMLATQAQLNNLHDLGLVFSPQYQQTMILYIQLLEAHKLLLDAERNEDIRKADSVKNVISTIIVRKPCLQYLLDILNIHLDYVKSDTLTPSQLAFVRELSQMCPYDMGEAVYRARNLRSIYENVSYPGIEECAPPRIAPRSSENLVVDSRLILYPNPSSDELNISLNFGQNEKGSIRISDITGKILENFSIGEYESNTKVNVSDFNSGIYFVRYISASGIEKTEKLVISK